MEDLWEHAERYRLLHMQHGGDLTHLVRLGQRDHLATLEAAEQRDAARVRNAAPSISRGRR